MPGMGMTRMSQKKSAGFQELVVLACVPSVPQGPLEEPRSHIVRIDLLVGPMSRSVRTGECGWYEENPLAEYDPR